MSTKIFIAVGSTAVKGLSELISRLKECGIFRNDSTFKDQFIAIDTDSTAIENFRDSGNSQNVNGICIPPTNLAANATCTIPSQDANTYVTPFNKSWTSEDIAVDEDGVFGYRRKSNADLSWVAKLESCIAKTYDREEPKEYELVFVATSYGGSSSGLLMNVAEIARTCVDRTTPSWCFLLLPSETLKDSKDYDQGWKNFLNMWQQLQQAVWERKLDGEKFAFPFFAGYAQDAAGKSVMARKLFKIKEDIRNYTPAKTGCHLPFNTVFPLVPNSKEYDSRFAAPAISELAIFLFYADAISLVGNNGNLYAQGHNFFNEDERNFMGLRLVGARCSSYGTFYRMAFDKIRKACEDFLGANLEKVTPGHVGTDGMLALDIQEVKAKFEAILAHLKGNLTTGSVEKVIDEEIVKSNIYYEFIRRFVNPFPTFDQFVNSGVAKPGADASSAWLLATYKNYYKDVNALSQQFDSCKNKLGKIFRNIEDMIERYAKRPLSQALNAEENLSDNILRIAQELLIKTFEAYHRAAVAKASLEFFKEKQAKSQAADKNSYIGQVHHWVLEDEKVMGGLNWNDLRAQLTVSDTLDDGNQSRSMFVRNILGDMTTACNDYKIDDEAMRKIHAFLIKFMLAATFKGKGSGLERIKGLQVVFDAAMDTLINKLQDHVANKRASGAADQYSIRIDLDQNQQPFWPSDVTIKGQSPCYTYFAKGGASTRGINFEIPPTKIRGQLLDTYKLNSFSDLVKKYDINDDRNADCLLIQRDNVEWNIVQEGTDGQGMTRSDDGVSYIEFSSKHPTCPVEDLFGLWVGEGCICMSAVEVIESYLTISTLPNVDSLKDLQSRILFTLPENIFYGMFIGIVRNKLKEALEGYKEINGYEVTIQNRVILKIRNFNDGPVYNTKTTGGVTLEDLGYNFTTKLLEAVPLDMMISLGQWFKRRDWEVNKGETSEFAKSLGDMTFNGMTAARLEELLERKEVAIFQNNMSYGIEEKIKTALDELFEKCKELVSFEIVQ